VTRHLVFDRETIFSAQVVADGEVIRHALEKLPPAIPPKGDMVDSALLLRSSST
jgi:hypothetical protein